MDARYLFPFVILAGCSRQTDTSPAESDAAVSQISYAEALQIYEKEQKKYEQLSEMHAAAVQRQKQESETADPAKAEELRALIAKLAARQAEQKEKLDVARKARQEAHARERPARGEEATKAFGSPAPAWYPLKPQR